MFSFARAIVGLVQNPPVKGKEPPSPENELEKAPSESIESAEIHDGISDVRTESDIVTNGAVDSREGHIDYKTAEEQADAQEDTLINVVPDSASTVSDVPTCQPILRFSAGACFLDQTALDRIVRTPSRL